MGRRPGTGQDDCFGHVNAIDHPEQVEPKIPGEILYGAGPVRINKGKDAIRLTDVNTADRPVQVGRSARVCVRAAAPGEAVRHYTRQTIP